MTFTLRFELEKTTKGAVRYQEVRNGDSFVIGALYIRKSALALAGEPPKTIHVTVTEGQ